MTTKTNYRAALEAMPVMKDDNIFGFMGEVAGWLNCWKNETKKAFLIAERVESEPSKGMTDVISDDLWDEEFAIEVFETMRDQLLAEVDAELDVFKKETK